MRREIAIVGLGLISLIAGLVVGQDGETVGLKGLKVPLEYYPDGSLKALLKADISSVDSSGQKIKGEGVRYETYAEDGTTNVVITAEECFYNKKNGQAESDSRVTLVRDDFVITGKGFKLDSKKEIISLQSEVVVEFAANLMSKEKKK
jgi:lipopolysaccharide export system protein LptC